MKLLYVIVSMGLGGAEQHLLRVSSALHRRGFEPEIFVILPGGPLTSAFVEAGVPVHGAHLPGWLARLLRDRRLIAGFGLFFLLLHCCGCTGACVRASCTSFYLRPTLWAAWYRSSGPGCGAS